MVAIRIYLPLLAVTNPFVIIRKCDQMHRAQHAISCSVL